MGLSQDDLVERIPKGITVLREWEQDKRKVGHGDMISLSETLGVNLKWLEFGMGDMLRPVSQVESAPTMNSRLVDVQLGPGKVKVFYDPVNGVDGKPEFYIKTILVGLTVEDAKKEMRQQVGGIGEED